MAAPRTLRTATQLTLSLPARPAASVNRRTPSTHTLYRALTSVLDGVELGAWQEVGAAHRGGPQHARREHGRVVADRQQPEAHGRGAPSPQLDLSLVGLDRQVALKGPELVHGRAASRWLLLPHVRPRETEQRHRQRQQANDLRTTKSAAVLCSKAAPSTPLLVSQPAGADEVLCCLIGGGVYCGLVEVGGVEAASTKREVAAQYR